MPLLRLNRRPARLQLVLFALAWIALAIFGRGRALAHGRIGLALWLRVAAVVPVACLAFGWEGLRRLYVAACLVAYPLGWVISHVVLAAIYYLVFAPVGWAMRLCGRDPLQRRFDASASSYWQPRPPAPKAESYFRPS